MEAPTPGPTPRQELLKSLWQSFSSQDKSYLLHLHSDHQHNSVNDTSTADPKPVHVPAALSSSNPLHVNPADPKCPTQPSVLSSSTSTSTSTSTPPTHNRTNSSFATGYTRSRLNDLTRQFTNDSAGSDGSKLTKEDATKREHERVLGYRMSRISKIKKFETIAQKHADQHSSSRSILRSKISDNDSKMNNKRRKRLSTKRRLSVHKKPGEALNNTPIDQVTPQMKSTKTIMTMNEQDEIVYNLLTQQMILEHTRQSGMCGRLMTKVYPYFSPEPVSRRAKMTEMFIMVLVVVNVAMVVVATEIDLTLPSSQYLLVFVDAFELFSFVIFALEYVLRMWVCILDEKYAREGVIMGRLQYFISYNAIIDLMALIPTILEFLTNKNRGLSGTGIRLWRVIRIMKLEHYSAAFLTLRGGFEQQGHLWRLVLIYPCVALVIFATLLTFTETLENGADVHTAQYFASIPRSMFPTLLMLSGEAPLIDFTPGGQIVVALISIFSLVIMATATGILASGFESAMRENRETKTILEKTRRVLRNHIKENSKKKTNELKRRESERIPSAMASMAEMIAIRDQSGLIFEQVDQVENVMEDEMEDEVVDGVVDGVVGDVEDDVEDDVEATTTDTSLADSATSRGEPNVDIELVVTQAHVSRSKADGALDSTRTNNDNVNANATHFPDDSSEQPDMPPSRAISFD